MITAAELRVMAENESTTIFEWREILKKASDRIQDLESTLAPEGIALLAGAMPILDTALNYFYPDSACDHARAKDARMALFTLRDRIREWVATAGREIRPAHEQNGFQLVSESAIAWLHDNHPDVYTGFYDRVDKPIPPSPVKEPAPLPAPEQAANKIERLESTLSAVLSAWENGVACWNDAHHSLWPSYPTAFSELAHVLDDVAMAINTAPIPAPDVATRTEQEIFVARDQSCVCDPHWPGYPCAACEMWHRLFPDGEKGGVA